MSALWLFAVAALICLAVFGVFVKWESHLEHHPRWESHLEHHPRGKYRRQQP
jgi:hypothetical protein